MKFGEDHQQEKLVNVNSIGVIILSRYSSSRLPGKALIEIMDKPVLQYIFERVSQVFTKDQIVIATSQEKTDDPIIDFAHRNQISTFRGSLENVAERFYLAAKLQNWDYAIRINGDNIFVDTTILGRMSKIAMQENFDFISNVKGRTFPKGMSIEIVKLRHFEKLMPKINAWDKYKEHVTLFLYEHENLGDYFFFYNTETPDVAGIQLALDTPADLQRSKDLIEHFDKPHYNYNLPEIVQLLNIRK